MARASIDWNVDRVGDLITRLREAERLWHEQVLTSPDDQRQDKIFNTLVAAGIALDRLLDDFRWVYREERRVNNGGRVR